MTKVYSEPIDINEDADQTQHSPNDDVNGMIMLEQLISNEENYTANVLLKCLKLCPSAFGGKKLYLSNGLIQLLSQYFIFE